MSLPKKWLLNNLVTVFTGLPNLAINFGTQTILDVGFHWSGWYAVLAYMIGTGLSVQYSVVWAMLTKTNFKVFRWRWDYSTKKAEG